MVAWSEVPIGCVARRVNRAEVPQPGKSYRQLGVRLWGEGAYEREAVDGAATRYKTLNRTNTGDIVVNKIWARSGSVSVVQDELDGSYVSSEFPLYEPESAKLLPRWFFWITKTRWFWERCDEKARGTSGKNRIRPSQFEAIGIPLPPLQEQRRIVAKIERLAAKIEEARGLRENTLGMTDAMMVSERARVMEDCLRKSAVPITNVADLQRGRFSHRPRNDPRFFGGRHPWIQIGEIESAQKYIRTWSETLNDEGLAVSRMFPAGTLLISIAATIGAVGILSFDCCIPDSIVAVTPHDGISTEFVYHYLVYLRTHLEELAPQSAQKNINLRILSDLPFPSPGIPKQHEVIGCLNKVEQRADQLKQRQMGVSPEIDALLPSVLGKAFRGEL